MRKNKAKGVKFARPTAKMNKLNYSIGLYKMGKHTVKKITDIIGVSKATLYKRLGSRCDSLVPYLLYNAVEKRRI